MASSDSTKLEVGVGEVVLCRQGPTYWEAKVLAVYPDEDSLSKKLKNPGPDNNYPMLLVHYQNWNSRWDEIVSGPDRVLKDTEDNRIKKKELDEAHASQIYATGKKKRAGSGTTRTPGAGGSKGGGRDGESSRGSTPSFDAKVKSSRASTASDSTTAGSTRKRRLGGESEVETKKEFESRPEIQVKLPEALKKILVDDWDLVCNQYKLLHLPAKLTVQEIIHDFLHTRTKPAKLTGLAAVKHSQLEQSAKGVVEYFDTMLGNQLLYKFERPQYTDYYEKNNGGQDKRPSEYYGLIHLLRLFVRIGTNLAYTRWDEKSIALIIGHVQTVIEHIHKNYEAWYDPEIIYHTAPPHYQKDAWA